MSVVQMTLVDVQTSDGAAVTWGTLTHEGPWSVAAKLVTTPIVILKHIYEYIIMIYSSSSQPGTHQCLRTYEHLQPVCSLDDTRTASDLLFQSDD